jgi:hypothetical protein
MVVDKRTRLQNLFICIFSSYIEVGGLDGECPYDFTEISGGESFGVYRKGVLMGRVLRWVDCEDGWVFEWGYEGDEWLAICCFEDNDFEVFLSRLQTDLPAFLAFLKIPNVRVSDRYAEIRAAWDELGCMFVEKIQE